MQFRVLVSATLTANRLARSVYLIQGRQLQNLQTKSPGIRPSYSVFNQLRNCSKMSDDKIVSYEEVVTYKDKPEVYLVDVREPKELEETGRIPASINIPLGDLANALNESGEGDFKKKFNKDFPDKTKKLVFYCKMGGRATKAMDEAIKLGYTNSKVYKGSWQDWSSHQ